MKAALSSEISVSGNQWPSGACPALRRSSLVSLSRVEEGDQPTPEHLCSWNRVYDEERGRRSYTGNSLTSLKYCRQHEGHCFRARPASVALNRPINHLGALSGNSDCVLFVREGRARSAIPANSSPRRADRAPIGSTLEGYTPRRSARSTGSSRHTTRRMFLPLSPPPPGTPSRCEFEIRLRLCSCPINAG